VRTWGAAVLRPYMSLPRRSGVRTEWRKSKPPAGSRRYRRGDL